jgi:hypothetical protein
MQAMRKAVNIAKLSPRVIHAGRNPCNIPVLNSVSRRSFSVTLLDKEHAEESRYIQQIEAKRQVELKKKLDSILALEDGHEDKESIINMLGECYLVDHST